MVPIDDDSSRFARDQGFTLVEVLISVSLLALLTLILFGAFFLARRAMEKASVESYAMQEFRSATDMVASHVRSAYPYRVSEREAGIFFHGSSGDLHFISALSVGLGGRGMSQVQISLDEGAGRDLILRERMPPRAWSENAPEGHVESVVLYRGARDLRISYLDPQEGDDRWLEAWDGKQAAGLPRAVRIDFLDRDGEEIEWVFPIMMSVLSG
jgi:general secretion pathway protein J